MKTWAVNLWNTKRSMLIGDVGEAVALHYLSDNGFFVVTRPVKLLHDKLYLVSAHYQLKPPKIDRSWWLTSEQKEYLEKFPAWDYVAFRKEGEPYIIEHEGKRYIRYWKNPYLIEVKTVRGMEKPGRKFKWNAVREAQSLGFKPILVIVNLLENWNISVQANEL